MRIVTALMAGVLLAGAPLGSAVAQRGKVAAPRITVQSLEPLPAQAAQQRFRVRLVVDNANTDPVEIRGIEFKLRLADQGIIDGAAGAMRIEALDRQTVTLEIGSEIISSWSRLLSFVQGPANTLPYEIYGQVHLARRRLDPLQFSTQGQVPLVMTGER